jgi:integrase
MSNALTTLNSGSTAIDHLPEVTAADRLRVWLQGLGKNSQRAYARDLSHLANQMNIITGNKEADVVTALEGLCRMERRHAILMMEQWRNNMVEADLAAATINRRLSAVNSALREIGKADIGPGRLDIKQVKREARKEVAGPSISKVARVIHELVISDDPAAARDLAIVLLGVQRGLRRAEITALTLADVDLEAGKLKILRKGKREKVSVDIEGAAVKAMAKWLTVRKELAHEGVDAVFIALGNRSGGKAMSDTSIYNVVRRAGELAGDSTWRTHGLRHTAITEALRLCNGSLAAAQEFAGHSDPSTTMRYVDDKDRLQKQAVSAMASVFSIDED